MSTPTSTLPSSSCPRCGRSIPANAALGACPHCLLVAGLTSEPAASNDAAPPPTPAELAPEFPQLELLELLGRGGMGAVYKARQRSLDRFVAVKLLRPGLDADPSFAERFTREARALAQLNHPGVVTLYEFGRTPGGQFFFLMEFVDGLNLRQLLAAGRLSPREALAIVPPLCDALQYAHDRGLVHRDIKPENILMDRLGRVKIADFGLAKLAAPPPPVSAPSAGSPGSPSHPSGASTHASVADSATSSSANPVHLSASLDLTEQGKVMGTPRYMAPEQRERPDTVDHRADIYALGVVLYQMLTGELPDTKHLQPPSHRVQLDVRLDAVVLRALEKDPSLRFVAANELKTQIEHISDTLTNSPDVPAPHPLPQPQPAARTAPLGAPLAPHPRSPRFTRWINARTLGAVGLAIAVSFALRQFVVAPFRIAGSSIEPDVPAGSLAFVYKLTRQFSPGDIVAYHETGWIAVGRVVSDGPDKGTLVVTRNNQTPSPVGTGSVIGKVVFNTRPSHPPQSVIPQREFRPTLSEIKRPSFQETYRDLTPRKIDQTKNEPAPSPAAPPKSDGARVAPGDGAKPEPKIAGNLPDPNGNSPINLQPSSPSATAREDESRTPKPSSGNNERPPAPPAVNEAEGTRSPTLAPTGAEIQRQIIQVRLEQARRLLQHAQARRDTGVGDSDELPDAKDQVAILEAELAGDHQAIAKVHLDAAERRVRSAVARQSMGLTTNLEVEDAKTALAVAKLEFSRSAENSSQPAPRASTITDTQREIALLKLEQAKRVLRYTQIKLERGSAGPEELLAAKDGVAFIEAELTGDALALVRAKIASAEHRLQFATRNFHAGVATKLDLDAAKTDLAVLKLELAALAPLGETASSTPKTTEPAPTTPPPAPAIR